MKTLIGKMRTGAALKLLEYMIAAYLLASWGVNGVINPLHYFRNAAMQTKALELSECADGIVIEMPQDTTDTNINDTNTGFLSFRIAAADDYSFYLTLLGCTDAGETKETGVKAQKGWNSVDIGKLQGGAAWKKIIVPKNAAGTEGIRLESVCFSKYRRTDTGRMCYIFVSILFLAALWECVWWIKKKYAE